MDYDLDNVIDIQLNHAANFVSAEDSACGFRFWVTSRIKKSAFGDMCEFRLFAACCEGCDAYQLLVDYKISLIEEKCSTSKTEGDYVNNLIIDDDSPNLHVQFELIDKNYSSPADGDQDDTVADSNLLRISYQEVSNNSKICINNASSTADNNFLPNKDSGGTFKLRLRIKVREMLPQVTENYHAESTQRDFELLIASRSFFVNLSYLAHNLKSDYFQNLLKTKEKGINRSAIFGVSSADEFQTFLDALCTYRKPIVTNRNFDVVLRLSTHFFVETALRACESYLSECTSINVIRKLEYAAEHGFGLLGESLIKQLCEGSPYAHIEALHEYMNTNKERLDQQHPDVLQALNIFDDYLIC